jgi:hypothetical protein
MIDSKTRKKVIALWRNGENKASIQRKTKVSQPSIRKIIDEIELEEGTFLDQRVRTKGPEKPEKRVQPVSTIFEDDKSLIYHKFILNFSKVLPLKRLKGNPLQVLAQGISIRICLYGIHKIQIQQLTTKETRFWYTLPGEEPFDFARKQS